jgi:hypothetical protein
MKRLALLLLGLCTIVFIAGCQKKQPSARITMAEGSLSVRNYSEVDIYPVVRTAQEEDLGVVSIGAGATVGFARIDADKQARVVWAEKDFEAPKRTVVFPLKITEEIAKQTKHLEFLYKGNGVWLLNLYSSSPPGDSKPVASIGGEISQQ